MVHSRRVRVANKWVLLKVMAMVMMVMVRQYRAGAHDAIEPLAGRAA